MLKIRDSRGSAVAEVVVIMPALLLLLSLLFSTLGTASVQIRCREVAASIARAIERDEEEHVWRSFASRALPNADVHIHHDGELIVVRVSHASPLRIRVDGQAVVLP
jgi:hypothetical protein